MRLKTIVEEEIRKTREDAHSELKRKFPGVLVTMRGLRPDDVTDFVAGSTGTSKTMGENDLTVATGTTENELKKEISSSEAFVMEGIYLPTPTGVTVSYVAMYIGSSKHRWWRGSIIGSQDDGVYYFPDPLLVKPGEKISVRFLTSAAATLNITLLGTVFRAQS